MKLAFESHRMNTTETAKELGKALLSRVQAGTALLPGAEEKWTVLIQAELDKAVSIGRWELEEYRSLFRHALDEAEVKAWESLGRYKFQMFGYWAAWWVKLNKLGQFKRPNPWSGLVQTARGLLVR